MATGVQITFDAADPNRLAQFWATALGYVLQPPPEGYDSWEEWATDVGIPPEEENSMSAVVDLDGDGPRLLFQRVPEAKTAKNRVHLDVNVGKAVPERQRRAHVDAEVERLVEAGATQLRAAEERGEYWIVMADPEGNEFCLQ
ncbi:VOC family protein [soil metagenome]